MWPWEHVLFAYVFYSLYVHLRFRRRPDDWPVVVLAFASVLPDLIDKPLAWQFGVFETGWGPSHSVFVAVPASVLALAVGWRLGTRSGTSFAFGYLLHLVGDVVPYSLGRSSLQFAPVLWPVGNPSPGEYGSFVGGVRDHAVEYAAQLAAGDITMTLVLQVGSVSLGTLLWLADGLPGLRLAVVSARRTVIELIPE
jgi:hypothetical protein